MTKTTEDRPERDASEVLDDLWRIADVKGHDFVYMGIDGKGTDGEGCSYVVRDEQAHPIAPGCIVGHWLHSHGVSLPNMGANEGYYTSHLHDVYDNLLPFKLSDKARRLLHSVQQQQDDRETWGDAIRIAAEHHGLIY